MRKWCIYGMISVIIAGMFYWGYLLFPNDYESKCAGTIIDLIDEQYISAVSGYDIVGERFVRNNDDPQLYFSNIGQPVSSFEISLSDVSEKVYWVEVYYAEAGRALCEANCEKQRITSAQKDEIFIEIPKGDYATLRIDINADFKIDKIIAGSEGAHLVSTKKFNIGSYLGIVFLFLLGFALFDKQKQKGKITNKQMLVNSLIAISCFIVFFVLQYVSVHDTFFASDEGDNFIGGIVVASGHDVYSTHTSQHMPLMYYICSIFTLLGARNVFEYRICFYGFMALLWIALIFRYRKDFGTATMIMYPVLYICTTRVMGDLSTTVLADQVQAQGMVILILELLIYIFKKRVDGKSIVCISIGVFLAFGTAFVAAFAIIPIVIYVFGTEIIITITNSSSVKEGIVLWVNRNGLLLGGVLLPFAILSGWYIISGNLYNAFYGAYVVNTEYYSKYYGVGGSFWQDIIVTFKRFARICCSVNPFYLWIGIISLLGMFILLLCCKKTLGAMTLVLCLICSGVRGFVGYHSHAYNGMAMMIFAVLVFSLYRIVSKILDNKNKYIMQSVKSVMILVVLMIIWHNGKDTFDKLDELTIKKEDVSHEIESFENYVITQLTDPGDYIFAVSLDCGIFMDTMTIQAAPNPSCIWIYEAYREEIFEKLEKNKPKLVLLPEVVSIWGYELRDYGADVYDYVEKYYTKIPIGNLYIRNENINDYKQIAGQYE